MAVDAVELCKVCGTDEPDEWVQCDICQSWFHLGCLELTPRQIKGLVEFHCTECAQTHGPSIEPRNTKRQRVRLNYAALNEGIVEIERTHAHARWFGTSRFKRAQFPSVRGDEIPDVLTTPVFIPKTHRDTLGMTIPEHLNLKYVVDLLGPSRTLPVMDVVTQNVLPGWTLGKWLDYVNSSERKQTLNVISLEFTHTPLQEEIVRPEYVRRVDLVDKVWPENASIAKPKVSHYCLSSVTGSYTDFHVDFGGTSVFYHVVSGYKTFLFIPPTHKNMQAYEEWCLTDDQSIKFFADLVTDCWRVDLGPGDSIIIPSGWIHAVHTPSDALVIGGNFLTLDSLKMELGVSSIENRTNVPSKYTYPRFSSVLWYLGSWLVQHGTEQEARDSISKETATDVLNYLKQNKDHRPRDVPAGVIDRLAELAPQFDVKPKGQDLEESKAALLLSGLSKALKPANGTDATLAAEPSLDIKPEPAVT